MSENHQGKSAIAPVRKIQASVYLFSAFLNDELTFCILIPGADKKDINLYQAATDIVIKTGNFKRNIPLPNILREYVVTGAKYEDGILNIRFGKGEGEC